MKKKLLAVLLGTALLSTVFSACAGGAADTENSSEEVETETIKEETPGKTQEEVKAEEINAFLTSEAENLLTDSDYFKNYLQKTFTQIVLVDGASRVQEATSTNENDVITIHKGGYYLVSGSLSDGQIIIDVDKSEKVYLFLDNVSVHSKTSAPLYVISADKVILSLLPDTVNTFSDEVTGVGENDDELSACIYSMEDLTINGTGTLKVNAKARDGITSKDSLKLVTGQIEIESEGDGIYGKDEIILMDADVKILSGGGIGEMKVNTHGGANHNAWGVSESEKEDKVSQKGLKSEGQILLLSGSVNAECNDDAIHAAGPVKSYYTEVTVGSSDDGMHSDDLIEIYDGEILVTESYEGIEAPAITINGGQITVHAVDDGFSASGKDGRGALIMFNGGKTVVDARGDGLDSNDTIICNGGEVTVFGPSENFDGYFDVERALLINGGVIFGAGSSGMLCIPSNESEQLSFTATGLSGVEGTKIQILDADENVCYEETAIRKFSALTFSDPNMKEGDVYTILFNDATVKTVTVSTESFDPNGWNRTDKPGEPPEMSDGERPEMPDGEMPGGEPPKMPDGEMPGGEPPERPDGPQGRP